MSCTSPIYRVPLGSESFKLLNGHDRSRVRNEGVLFFDLDSVIRLKEIPGFNEDDIQILPCGQCRTCRLGRSKEWAVRCALEADRHKHNYFVTLTYDDFHLPKGEFLDYSRNLWESNLRKSDVQKFLKNLRQVEVRDFGNVDEDGKCPMKVFYCGEYGDQNGRPHYHLILFGCSEIPDLVYNFTKGNYKYYKSAIYERCWSTRESGVKVPRGFVDITEASFDNMAYTARYVMKKIGGLAKKEFMKYYDTLDPDARPEVRLAPFLNMSLKKPIGIDYFIENMENINLEDKVKYMKKFELHQSRPPRYFEKLFERDDPEGFKAFKARRKKNGIAGKKFRASRFSESERGRMLREDSILAAKEKKYYVRSL